MTRVKIKSPNPRDPRRTTKLLEILSCNDVYVTRLIPVHDGFIILTSSDNELDKIFNNTTDKELEENEFTPQIPPELSSNRSVLLFRVDNHIYDNTERNIRTEIENQNEWVGQISKVSKFISGGNIIKVTFSETQKAKKAQESGLKMFSMRIPSHDIKQDEHINIMTCMRCYKMEEHSTAQCDQDRNYKICSECSSPNHTWRECDAGENKRCISCQGQHSTLAMGCPTRKEIVNKKRKERKNTGSTMYSEKVKRGTSNQVQVIQHQEIRTAGNNTTSINIYQAMLHSHFVNVGKPGSYTKTFNDLMKAHNLPTLKIQEDPPSLEIITRLSEVVGVHAPATTQAESMETGTGHVEEEHPMNKTQEAQKTQQPENSQGQRQQGQQTGQQQLQEQQPKQQQGQQQQQQLPKQGKENQEKQAKITSLKSKAKPNMKAQDIGLTIITSEGQGWQKGLTNETLAEALRENKLKYTYTDNMFEDEEIIGLINNNLVELKGCFTVMDNAIFKKQRSGLIKVHSPPSHQESSRRRLNSK